jgi:phage terminase Nu1 subunit (DNA packaging protein)
MKAKTRTLIDVVSVAKFLNLDKRRIQQLVIEGMPRPSRGKYDLSSCAAWYIRYLQNALEKKIIPGAEGIQINERQERLRILKADADLKEIDLAKERGLLVSIVDVEKEMSNLVLTTKARVLAVAPRVAPELIGENSRVMIQARVEKALKEALLHLEVTSGSTSNIQAEA